MANKKRNASVSNLFIPSLISVPDFSFLSATVIFSLYAKDISNGVISKDDMINYTTKYADVWSIEYISYLFDDVRYFIYTSITESSYN